MLLMMIIIMNKMKKNDGEWLLRAEMKNPGLGTLTLSVFLCQNVFERLSLIAERSAAMVRKALMTSDAVMLRAASLVGNAAMHCCALFI